MSKFGFSRIFKYKPNIDDIKINFIKVKYTKIKKLTIRYQFILSFLAYIVIAHGYYKADYYPLMILTLLSLFILILFFILKRKKRLSDGLSSILFIYIPIANILIKDVFFLLQGNPLIDTIFLHTHFMLLLFISFGGMVTNPRHILYVGGISVVWIWIFTIYLNDPYLWSLVVLDSLFFTGISTIIYLTYSHTLLFNSKFNDLARTINHQNEDLNKLMNFKDWMLNMILHDIKNPINRILSASKMDIIQKEELTQPSNHILSIVENILDVYKMEDSKMKLKLSIQNIDSIIQKGSKQVRYLLEDKKLTLVNRITVKPAVEVDVELMVRVIVNLLTNSIKFSNANSHIDIQVLSKDNRVRVEILDNGEEISPQNIERIFEKYYQGNAQNLGSTRSTGIGLTFCKLAIEAHGGAIGAVSVLNYGTMIWFELPVKSENEITGVEIIRASPIKYEYTFEEEKSLLQYKFKLANLAIYKTSEMLTIFQSIPLFSSPGLQYWKEEVIKASMAGNVEYYNQLREIPLDLAGHTI